MHQQGKMVFHLGDFIRRVPEQVHGVAAAIAVTFGQEIENIQDDRAEFGHLTNEALTFRQCLGGA